MRTVPYKSVLRGVLAREGGGNLATAAATDPEIARVIEYVSDRFRTAWEFYAWPEIFVTEERTFRAEWDAAATYAEDDEVYFPDEPAGYYRALAATSAGESPATTAAKWEEMATFARLVEFEQAGETAFEACVGVWDRDPEADPSAVPVPYRVTADGILLPPDYAYATAWLRVRKVCPPLTPLVYDEAATYLPGVEVYFDAIGDVYTCLEATAAGETPATDAAKWAVVPFPMIFARAVKAGALADWQRSDGEGSAVKTRDSEERFVELLDDQVCQLTKLQGQTGRIDVVPRH